MLLSSSPSSVTVSHRCEGSVRPAAGRHRSLQLAGKARTAQQGGRLGPGHSWPRAGWCRHLTPSRPPPHDARHARSRTRPRVAPREPVRCSVVASRASRARSHRAPRAAAAPGAGFHCGRGKRALLPPTPPRPFKF